jgi:uncharacterized repeat protein (TIGR01451 family)
MFKRAIASLLTTAAALAAGQAHAAGTQACTTITNSATATYGVGGNSAAPVRSSVSFTVDELISVRVTSPATPTNVVSPDTNRVLAFIVTNVGNGQESFTLAPGYTVPGDNFDPTPGSAGTLFRDVNGDGQYTAGVDTPITGAIALDPDQSMQVLVVANIPVNLTDGSQGKATLAAVSATSGAAGAAPGTVLAGQGCNNVDAMVGVGPNGPTDSGSDDSGTGTYQVSSGLVRMSKTLQSVVDPFGTTCAVTGGNQSPCLVPGAMVEYRITVTVTSAASTVAQNLVITDNVPANTTYVAGSIRVNGIPRTDAVDPDDASCAGCGNATGTLTANLGNVTGTVAGVVTTIDYKVRIN